MAIQLYNTDAARNLIAAEYKMLRHAEGRQVLSLFGQHHSQPLNKSDSRVFRRINPYNVASNGAPQITASNFVAAEGLTPVASTITFDDVTMSLNHYTVLFKFSAKSELTYEDDIPGSMAKISGETVAEIVEKVCYGQVQAGDTVDYTNGSTRSTLASVISLSKLQAAARTLEDARGDRVTEMIKPGPNFDTSGVEASYLVFIHTDLESDFRKLDGFTRRVEYGSAITPVHPREIGAVESFRIITSPLFSPVLAGGAAVGGGFKSVGAANNDVYPVVITAQDAWGQISLKGHTWKSAINPTIISSQEKNHYNPSGQFGYVGCDFWFNAGRLNENWLIRIETCATDL